MAAFSYFTSSLEAWKMPNFTTFLDVNIHYFPVKRALVFPARNEYYTYRDLLNVVNRLGNGLKRLGVKKGDRVCVYLPSCPETLISYFATWRIGGVCVPANIILKKHEVTHIIRNSESSMVITNEQGYREVILPLKPEMPALRNVVIVGGKDIEGETVSWKSLVEESPSGLRAENCGFDDLCQLQYTAGTTGLPKSAMLTHGNWMAAVEAEGWVLGLSENDVYLGFYPMAHVGVSWGISVLKAGGTFIIMERFNLEEYLKLTAQYGVTVLSGMPPVLHTLVNSPPGTEDYFRTVRVVISGGGPLPQKVWEDFERRFRIPVANAYGLSETIVVGTAPSVTPKFTYLSKGYKSVGAPVGYCEVKIVDEKNPQEEKKPNEVGEIALRGPGVAKGYWRNPEATAEAFLLDGWFLTGDLGYLDEDGVLYVTDRKKDLIIMSGWNIYPAEVENVLLHHPKIADVAVFARYDERRGEIPAAAVVLKPGEKADEEDIISFARERLADYKVPRAIVFVDSIPRMGGWKTLRRVLREKYGGFPSK